MEFHVPFVVLPMPWHLRAKTDPVPAKIAGLLTTEMNTIRSVSPRERGVSNSYVGGTDVTTRLIIAVFSMSMIAALPSPVVADITGTISMIAKVNGESGTHFTGPGDVLRAVSTASASSLITDPQELITLTVSFSGSSQIIHASHTLQPGSTHAFDILQVTLTVPEEAESEYTAFSELWYLDGDFRVVSFAQDYLLFTTD